MKTCKCLAAIIEKIGHDLGHTINGKKCDIFI